MDNRSLLVEAQITGEKTLFDCPIELKFYGTNEPVERENLLSQMRADKLPIGHVADRKRKEAAVVKEREKLAKQAAKQAQKKGGVVVGIGGDTYENGMADFMAGSSQGFGPGPSLEDIVGGSERYNPRNVEQIVEEFGVKEQDLVSTLLRDNELLLTNCRLLWQKQNNQTRCSLDCILSNSKASNGCWTKSLPSFQPKVPKT
jgi:SWI/SNF-related matrix-associated actin-dependent regulator of chromatin subfamily A3